MESFTYALPTQIYFGKDQIEKLSEALKPYQGKAVLLVYGKQSIKSIGIYERIVSVMDNLSITRIEESGVRPNPEMQSVLSGREKCLKHNVEFILAAGGGSVIDAAKAIAFSVTMKEDEIWDVFLGKKKPKDALPLGTILTLAATGTETNGNTVITNDATNQKRSCAYPFLIPQFSIIDPIYTMHVNTHYTYAGVTDIVMHVFEQYFSQTERTETADYLSFGLLKSVIENTERLNRGEDDYDTRANISWAATIGLSWLLAQGKKGDWATHQLSYPYTQKYGVTHGYALTSIYPAYLETILDASPSIVAPRLAFLGRELFEIEHPEQVIEAIKNMLESIFKAPTTFEAAGHIPDNDTIEWMADTVTVVGPVGGFVKVDRAMAKNIYFKALK